MSKIEHIARRWINAANTVGGSLANVFYYDLWCKHATPEQRANGPFATIAQEMACRARGVA